jgi:hypothetical protein
LVTEALEVTNYESRIIWFVTLGASSRE